MIHALDVAITQLGIHEATGHNDGVPATRYMRGNKLAWCAGFVLFCFDVSDDDDIHNGSNRSFWRYTNVAQFERNFKKRGLWFGWGIKPSPNDIIFFANRGRSDAGRGRHVGLVERVSDGRVHTIEGNLSDSVRRASHALTSSRITGYGRVCDTPIAYR